MAYLELEASSKGCQIYKMIMHIQSIVRTEAFSRELGIFRDINAYSTTLTGAQLGRRGETCPAPFENKKSVLILEKRDPDCVHHWVKFSIQNVVLRVSRRTKNS